MTDPNIPIIYPRSPESGGKAWNPFVNAEKRLAHEQMEALIYLEQLEAIPESDYQWFADNGISIPGEILRCKAIQIIEISYR